MKVGAAEEEGAAKFSALEGKVAGNTIRVAPSSMSWSGVRDEGDGWDASIQ